MGKRLWLLRHAKSDPGDASLDDHDRPLSARGRDAATRLGRHLAGCDARPELVRCSSALRARQTLEGLVRELEEAPAVEIEPDLYLASPSEILARVETTPESVGSLLLVGHNPGLGELAFRLSREGSPEVLAELRRKYPTGALAELELPSGSWADARRGCALRSFNVPRRLPA